MNENQDKQETEEQKLMPRRRGKGKKPRISNTKEYMKQKMRQYSKEKKYYRFNPKVYYTIEIEGKLHVFSVRTLTKIKPNELDKLDNPVVMI